LKSISLHELLYIKSTFEHARLNELGQSGDTTRHSARICYLVAFLSQPDFPEVQLDKNKAGFIALAN
jgi:hypothetical protein